MQDFRGDEYIFLFYNLENSIKLETNSPFQETKKKDKKRANGKKIKILCIKTKMDKWTNDKKKIQNFKYKNQNFEILKVIKSKKSKMLYIKSKVLKF